MKSCRWDAGQALEFTGCSHQTSECEGNVISVTEWVGFLWTTVSIVCTKWYEKQKTSNEKQFYRQKWLMRGQRRMTNWFELTGRLFKVTYLYNHSLQPQWAEKHLVCQTLRNSRRTRSFYQRTGIWGDCEHRLAQTGQDGCLVWWISTQMQYESMDRTWCQEWRLVGVM